MSEVIEVYDLTKNFRLYSKPFHRLAEAILRKPMHRDYLGLSNVTFCLRQGDCLGVIGENGAGKSTLLKIISGILTPCSGSVRVKGRVAALLELGAGFHSEFTGRQNIYLNASLFGLSEKEIKQKEAEIISFAEIGEFIDQPVKVYSSGMTVRLAFSIATSVDPDILIIDEALSVGDQYFQKKCIDRMLEFRKNDKTIIFCSHSMYVVNLLCERTLWIENGRIKEDGKTSIVTANYENYLRAKEDTGGLEKNDSEAASAGELNKSILSLRINGSQEPINVQSGSDLEVEVALSSADSEPYSLAVVIERNDGLVCHGFNLCREGGKLFNRPGNVLVKLTYPSIPLLYGQYNIIAFILDESGIFCYYKKGSAMFNIPAPEKFPNQAGLLRLDCNWMIKEGAGA